MKYRHELKFCVKEADLELLRTRISHIARKDQYQRDPAGYVITSLYFDDAYDRCEKETIDGYDRRHKYRIRIYDHDDGVIKLERKSKIRGMTSKVSAGISADECREMMKGRLPRIQSSYAEQKRRILTEMKIKGMKPKCIVQYQREAFVYPVGNVRITFDKNVCGSRETVSFLDERINSVPLLKAGMHILEVKYDELIPRYLLDALETENLMWTSFSKYGHARNVLK